MQTVSHIHNVVQLPLPFEGYPAKVTPPKGWSYLLSDSLAFKKDITHGIRIQKPAETAVPEWIERLIKSGQCETVYVENLSLTDDQALNIKALCSQFCVSLVNLTRNSDNQNLLLENVVVGPWKSA